MENVLKEAFRIESFRPKQKEIITSILDGYNTLGILPTGSGKSLCYQVPALILDGTTIVISPLISLMQDQVEALLKNDIEAAFINSNMTVKDQEAVEKRLQKGEIKILYVAPERFNNQTFLNILDDIHVPLIAFDEAHCISKWGHDFRPSYQEVIPIIEEKLPNADYIALTATATEDVEENIIELLDVDKRHIYKTSVKRENLHLSVNPTFQREQFILKYIESHKNESGIIYVSTRKDAEKLGGFLLDNDIENVVYHAGLRKQEREKNQNAFVSGKTKVIVATNAFGMGIDKRDIRFIIHYNLPGDLESYYQEIGRAGRDGEVSECILLSNSRDVMLQQFFIDRSTASEEQKENMRYKLERMIQYNKTSKCLSSVIIKYFDPDEYVKNCGVCSNCLRQDKTVDITEEAKKILGLIQSINLPVEKTIQVLRGEQAENIINTELLENPFFGELSGYHTSDVHHIIDELVMSGHLHLSEEILSVPELGREILEGKKEFFSVPFRKQFKEVVNVSTDTSFNESLYQSLIKKRHDLALEKGVEEENIFTDVSIREFAKKMPTTKSDMMHITGMGNYKLKHYSPYFIEIIESYKENRNKEENITCY